MNDGKALDGKALRLTPKEAEAALKKTRDLTRQLLAVPKTELPNQQKRKPKDRDN